jgi:hypothetical protein
MDGSDWPAALNGTGPGSPLVEPAPSGPGTGSEYSFVMVDVEHASDANLVVAVGRWQEQALAEVYRRHGGAAQ